MPGERIIAGRVVVLHGVMHGPDQGDLVHDLRHTLHAFADVQAGHVARNTFERPADSFGGVRLAVEHVDVARPAPLEEEDNGLGACGEFLRRFRAQQFRHAQAQQPEAAYFEEVASGHTARPPKKQNGLRCCKGRPCFSLAVWSGVAERSADTPLAATCDGS